MVDRAEINKIETMIRLVEVALTIGRHVLHIVWLVFGITVALAIYNFLVGDIAGGIVASLFAIGDSVMLAQIYMRRNRGYYRRHSLQKQPKTKFGETTSA